MSPVTVVTDTTHYLPREQLAAAGVEEISLYVNRGGELEREIDMPDFDDFYGYLRETSDLPTTSQPSIGDFLAIFEPLAAAGHDIVSVHLSGDISGTIESARLAGTELEQAHPGRTVAVVDSRMTAAGLGLVALAGGAAARGGGDLHQVVARMETAIDATKIWFALDTLEFLRRGGRIGPARAWLGGALKIKPILSIDGVLAPIERVRTSTRAFERMVDFLKARQADGADAWVVQHIQAADQAERLAERGREIFGSDPVVFSEIGPVVGTHVGPGLLGVGGIPSALLDDTRP